MKILDVEDLLIQILLRLPPKSLLRFQCVSKKWLSIISGPDFRRLHSRRLSALVTGLFLAPPTQTSGVNPLPYFVSLQSRDDENSRHTHTLANRLTGLGGGGSIVSLNSCNGLLCVWFEYRSNFCYVYNPTTNQSRQIQDPLPLDKRYDVIAMNIAFDPSKSHHYNLVCVYQFDTLKRYDKIGFSVFSSESRGWKESAELLPNEFTFYNTSGAFLNGAIHWYCNWNHFLCFDVDNARLRSMPSIPLSQGRCMYFGECGGHLHYIVQCGGHDSKLMNVFQMENDYSQWVFKCQVDLSYLTYGVFCEVPTSFTMYGFSIHLFVADDEGKEGLVISFPHKLILYHLQNRCITELAAYVWRDRFCSSVKTTLRNHSTCKHIDTLAYLY